VIKLGADWPPHPNHLPSRQIKASVHQKNYISNSLFSSVLACVQVSAAGYLPARNLCGLYVTNFPYIFEVSTEIVKFRRVSQDCACSLRTGHKFPSVQISIFFLSCATRGIYDAKWLIYFVAQHSHICWVRLSCSDQPESTLGWNLKEEYKSTIEDSNPSCRYSSLCPTFTPTQGRRPYFTLQPRREANFPSWIMGISSPC